MTIPPILIPPSINNNSIFILLFLAFTLLLSQVHPLPEKTGTLPPPRLLFANRKDIRLLDTQHRRANTTILVKNLSEATAVDVHIQKGIICWSDIEAEKIECQYQGQQQQQGQPSSSGGPSHANLQKKTLVFHSLPSPEDIAMDTLTDKLYWTDSENNRIEVVCLETKLRRVILWEDVDQPRAIALDTNTRIMFFSDWGEVPKIERASMDGQNRKVIVDKEIFWPNGIALDLVTRRVFWIDAKLHYIAAVDYNGGNRQLINQDGPLHPFSLAFYNNVLYWSDWHTNSLHSIRLDTGQIKVIITRSNINPMDVVVYENKTGQSWVNPCAGAKCSHLCLLSEVAPSGFTCACPIGVKLVNATHCNDGIDELLIVARGQDIRRISLDTSDYTDVIIPFTGIKHLVTLDYWNGSVFWTDDESRRIRRGSLTESTVTPNKYETTDIITEEIVHPDGLAIDWVAQNLYWTDAGTDRIEVSKLNGLFRKILVSRGLNEPRAIALDPSERYGLMFYSDWGKRPRIERARMDGSDRTVIVSENIHWPNGIAVDKGQIYWCDAKNDKIEMANYDGKNRQVLITADLPHTFGFSLLGDYIYWTDWQKRTVERAHKTTGEDRIIIKELFADPMGIVAIRPKSYNYTLNPCGWQRHECQHLCLYTHSGGETSRSSYCACASGYELDKNNKSCSLPEAFILYTNNGEIHRVSLSQSRARTDIVPVKGKNPSALDYDATESRIYWTDTKTNSIFRAFMNGSDTERVVDFGVVHPEGLAVDWLNRNMYWTDLSKNRISVAKLNGNFRKTIIWDVEAPRAIIVQPNKGWLYWSTWASTNPGPTIEKSALDGSKRSTVVGKIGRAYGLALEGDHLYWSDIDNYLIERVHLASGQRQVILRNGDNGNNGVNFKPFSIATYQSKIYMQDQESSTILVYNTVNKSLEKLHQNFPKSSSIQELKIYDRLKQESSTYTPCRDLSCSQLCFTVQGKGSSSNLTPVCQCESHYTLSVDNSHGCEPPTQYILFTGLTHVSRYNASTFDTIVLGGLRKVSQVDADSHYIYIVTNGILKKIRYPQNHPQNNMSTGSSSSFSSSSSYSSSGSSSYLNNVNSNSGGSFSSSSSSSSSISSSSVQSGSVIQENVSSFCLHGNVIFFASSGSACVNVTSKSGDYIGFVYCDPENGPQSDPTLTITPALQIHTLKTYRNWLFFSIGNRIERVTFSGIDKVTVANTTGSIGGFDIDDDMIYFSDTENKRIYASDIGGENRKVLASSNLGGPTRLTVMDRFVYWLDIFGGMERMEKWTGLERTRVLPRNENLTSIVHVNTEVMQLTSTCDDECLICAGWPLPVSKTSAHSMSVSVAIQCTCPQGQVLGLDGKSCHLRPSTCLSGEFQCRSGHTGCIHKWMECNGVKDCQDGSDEVNCPYTCVQGSKDENCRATACKGGDTAWCSDNDVTSEGYDKTWILVPVLLILVTLVACGSYFFVVKRRRVRRRMASQNAPSSTYTSQNYQLHQHLSSQLSTGVLAQGKSSSSSSSNYNDMLVGPHPSPTTTVSHGHGGTSHSHYNCCHNKYHQCHYVKETAPCPTPCSTDVCDNSDIYGPFSVVNAPPPSEEGRGSITSSPNSTLRMHHSYVPPPPSPS